MTAPMRAQPKPLLEPYLEPYLHKHASLYHTHTERINEKTAQRKDASSTRVPGPAHSNSSASSNQRYRRRNVALRFGPRATPQPEALRSHWNQSESNQFVPKFCHVFKNNKNLSSLDLALTASRARSVGSRGATHTSVRWRHSEAQPLPNSRRNSGRRR
jgi:hypothetical protein